MGSPQYWSGSEREPAIEWFATIPFGMNPAGHGGLVPPGRRAQALGGGLRRLQPRAAPGHGRTPPRWPAGSGRRSTRSATSRASGCASPNLGGKVYARAGATTVLTPGSEIYAALERGVIDAAEWIGPHDDMKIGLHKTARYYYYPGWHEPGTMNEFGFNKKAYEALPVDLRRTLDHAAAAVQVYGLIGLPREERHRARAAQDGVQGQGRGDPVPGAGAARSQEAGGRGRPGRIREDAHGPEGPRVLHEVPGAGGPVGPRRRGRLPSARRGAEEALDDRDDAGSSRRRAGAGGRGRRQRHRRRPLRHRAAEGPVAACPRPTPPCSTMLQGAAQRLAKVVEETSGGRFRIEVFPGGQIVPAVRMFRRRLAGQDRGVHGRHLVLDGAGRSPRSSGSRPSRSA